jgi:acyl-CoA thioesterase-2
MGDFEKDTRVEKIGDGRFRAELKPDWEIWGPNGGYVATLALRAAGACAQIPRPSSFTCHFLAIGRFEPVEVEVEVVRAGRRAELLRSRVVQGGRILVETLLRTASEGPGLEHPTTGAPVVPAPETLESLEALVAKLPTDPPPHHRFWENLDRRPLDPTSIGGPRIANPADWAEWYRFRPLATFEDRWVDAARYLVLIDTLSWPAASRPHVDGGFIAPSLDVTTWFHDFAPQEEWLLAHEVSRVARGGLMSTEGSVYSRDGRLLASGGSHLLCAPAPPAA